MNTDNTKPAFWDEMYLSGKDYMSVDEIFLSDLLRNENKNMGSALDLGCGTGDLVVKLSKKGFDVTGLDVSHVAIKKATERALKEGVSPRLLIGEISSLGEDVLYDVIFCKLMYAFIPEKVPFLKEVKKHLGRKGIFVIITPVLNATNKDIEKKPGICVNDLDIDKIFEVFPSTKEYKTEFFSEGRVIKTFISKNE